MDARSAGAQRVAESGRHTRAPARSAVTGRRTKRVVLTTPRAKPCRRGGAGSIRSNPSSRACKRLHSDPGRCAGDMHAGHGRCPDHCCIHRRSPGHSRHRPCTCPSSVPGRDPDLPDFLGRPASGWHGDCKTRSRNKREDGGEDPRDGTGRIADLRFGWRSRERGEPGGVGRPPR